MPDITAEQKLERFASNIKEMEQDLRDQRRMRDGFFLYLWENRLMSVTEMAVHAGIRRESVHDALRKARDAQEN